jgi:hypothetical protein
MPKAKDPEPNQLVSIFVRLTYHVVTDELEIGRGSRQVELVANSDEGVVRSTLVKLGEQRVHRLGLVTHQPVLPTAHHEELGHALLELGILVAALGNERCDQPVSGLGLS